MSSQLVYFITGANRGLGLALVNEIATKDATAIVYAGARDPSSASALHDVAEKFPSRVSTIKYVSGDVEVNRAAAKLLNERHGRVDVVIANAAIQPSTVDASTIPVDDVRNMFEVRDTPHDLKTAVIMTHPTGQVNTIGVLVLFQALFPLLRTSPTAKFIPISSSAGSLTYGIEEDLGLVGYGASKAALNYISRKIHFENEWITCFPLAPGIVDTDMLTSLCKRRDPTGELEKLVQSVQMPAANAAEKVITIITDANRASHGGEFLNFDGTKLPW